MNKQPPSLSTLAQPSESNKSPSIMPWQLMAAPMAGNNEQTPRRGSGGLQNRVQGSWSLNRCSMANPRFSFLPSTGTGPATTVRRNGACRADPVSDGLRSGWAGRNICLQWTPSYSNEGQREGHGIVGAIGYLSETCCFISPYGAWWTVSSSIVRPVFKLQRYCTYPCVLLPGADSHPHTPSST